MNQFASSIDYYMFRVWDEEGDPGVNHYPLMSSGPWATLTIIGCYLYFVKLTGPSIMKLRQPGYVKQLMTVYNFILVILSAWMTVETFLATNYSLSSWSCSESQRIRSSTDPKDELVSRRISFVLWVFLYNRCSSIDGRKKILQRLIIFILTWFVLLNGNCALKRNMDTKSPHK